ncbi:unnamed protein product [Discula destructiva]
MEGRNWLGFGPRAPRIPQAMRATNPNLLTTQSDVGAYPALETEQRDLQRSTTQIHTQQPPQKTPRLSRISTYMGLGNGAKAHATIATSSPYPEQIMKRSGSLLTRNATYLDVPHDPAAGIWHTRSNTDDAFIYKDSDQTWHNPTLTQMMDTVSSIIMTNGISEPIPRHLNSFVIGMVEEFRIRLGKHSGLEAKLEGLRNTRKKEIQEFAAMADEWKHREAAFKAEVKRLEQMIAGKDGMHSVVVARAGSMYNRNDARAFQDKLNRLSKSEDENLDLDDVEQIVMEGEMRNFEVLPIIKDSHREVVLDHNADVLMSALSRPRSQSASKRKTSPDPLGDRMAAAQRFLDEYGRPRLPNNSGSKTTSPRKSHSTVSSSAVPSSGSSSLIAQSILAARAEQDHVTPHTTPPRPEPVKPSTGAHAVQARTGGLDALQTIQELMKINGGLPEDAIDDESSYGTSFVPSRLARAASSAHNDGKSVTHDATVVIVEAKVDNASRNGPQRPGVLEDGADNSATHLTAESKVDSVGHNGHQRSQVLAARETAPAQVDNLESDVPHDFQPQFLKKSPSSSSSGSSKSSCRSARLMAMAHNCVNHIGQSGGPDCPRNSPMRSVQSGADPFPDEATKKRFRTERTVLNANIREHSYMTNEELRAVVDDRIFLQNKAQAMPAKRVHNANVPHVKAPEPLLAFPPGFEAHAAAGLLPFQQAARQRAAHRMQSLEQAAVERNEVIQTHCHALERKVTNHSAESDDMAKDA